MSIDDILTTAALTPPTMGPRPTVVALIVLLMSSTLVGCIGLVPAREFLETRRDSVETVTVYDRVAFSHTFTNLVETYSNSSSFYVDDSVTQIDVYFKASFVASDSVGCLDAGGTLRYVQATLTDPEGGVLWSTDVCSDSNPPEESYFATPSSPVASGSSPWRRRAVASVSSTSSRTTSMSS